MIVFLKTVQAPVKCQVEGTVFFCAFFRNHIFPPVRKVLVVPALSYVIIAVLIQREDSPQ